MTNPTLTAHAKLRQQQRNIPPLITDWLIRYGKSTYLGSGRKVVFFTKAKIRHLEKSVGREPVRRLADFLNCYLIIENGSQIVITMGKRFLKTRFRDKWPSKGRRINPNTLRAIQSF